MEYPLSMPKFAWPILIEAINIPHNFSIPCYNTMQPSINLYIIELWTWKWILIDVRCLGARYTRIWGCLFMYAHIMIMQWSVGMYVFLAVCSIVNVARIRRSDARYLSNIIIVIDLRQIIIMIKSMNKQNMPASHQTFCQYLSCW